MAPRNPHSEAPASASDVESLRRLVQQLLTRVEAVEQSGAAGGSMGPWAEEVRADLQGVQGSQVELAEQMERVLVLLGEPADPSDRLERKLDALLDLRRSQTEEVPVSWVPTFIQKNPGTSLGYVLALLILVALLLGEGGLVREAIQATPVEKVIK